MEVVSTLHRFPTHSTTVDTIDLARQEEGLFQHSDIGAGSLVVPLDDTTDIRVNDLVRFKIDGTVRHGFVVEQIEERTRDDQGAARRYRLVKGPGTNGVTGFGVIGPANGFGARPKENQRLFNVYAPQFPITSLDNAVLTTNPAIPANWPLNDWGTLGPWISTTSATLTSTPNGAHLLFANVTVASAVDSATIFIAADNWANVWVDGQPIMDVGGPDADHSYQRTFTATLPLSVGTHRIAVRLYNKGGDNHGGIRFLLATTNPDGSVDDVLLESGTDWKNIESPSPWPGMTPGQAVGIALGEIQDRGRLTWLSVDFDDDTDSAGTNWPVVGDISTRTGNSLLAFLSELAATYVDWVVDPATMTLSLYVKGDYAQVGGAPVTLEPAAVTAADGNIVELNRVIT